MINKGNEDKKLKKQKARETQALFAYHIFG